MHTARVRSVRSLLVLVAAALCVGFVTIPAFAQSAPKEYPLDIPPECSNVSALNSGRPASWTATTACRPVDPYGPVTSTVVDMSGPTGTVTFVAPNTTTTVPGCVVPVSSDPFRCSAISNYTADVSVTWPAVIAYNQCQSGLDCNYSLWWRTIYQSTWQEPRVAPLVLVRVGTCGMPTGAVQPNYFKSDGSCSYQVESFGTGGTPALTTIHFSAGLAVPEAGAPGMAFNACFSGCLRSNGRIGGVPPGSSLPQSTGTTVFVRTDADGGAPTADFTIAPSGSSANAVIVNASASAAFPGTTLTGYEWSFDDQTTASGITVTHEFPDANQHSITLTVTASNGKSASVTKLTSGPAILVVNSSGDRSDNDLSTKACDTGGLVGTDAECTLRAAMETAANSTGGARISFNIAATPTISVASPLPTLSRATVIDGTTQPSGTVKVVGSGPVGFLASTTVTIKGLTINGFDSAILANSNSPGSVFAKNTIDTGTAQSGTAIYAAGADSKIGGSQADANDITTRGWGILANAGSVVSYNTIGRTATSKDNAPSHGIIVAAFDGPKGQPDARIANNVINAWRAGVWVLGADPRGNPAGSVVESNKIGITEAGTEATVQPTIGVLIDGTPGVKVRQNAVNAYCGIQIDGSDSSSLLDNGQILSTMCGESVPDAPSTASDVEVTANMIGLLPDGETAVKETNSRGISLRNATDAKVRDNTIGPASNSGIDVRRGSGHEITGNRVNVNAAATHSYETAAGHMLYGISLDGATDVGIGTIGAGNVIGGTTIGAIWAGGRPSAGLTIAGNMLGVGTGDVELGNNVGVSLFQAADVTVQGNVITSSTGGAIRAAGLDGLKVAGNTIGLNPARTKAMPNGVGIVVLRGDRNNGLVEIGPNNTVGGNSGTAIVLNTAQLGKINGNFVGVTESGTAFPNGGGIGASATTLEISGNTVAANKSNAVEVSDTTTLTLSNNRVGVAPTGAVALPNTGGVWVKRVQDATIATNTIGGSSAIGLEVVDVKLLHLNENEVGVVGAGNIAVPNEIGAKLSGIEAGDITGNTFSGNRKEGLLLNSSTDAVVVERNRFGVSADGGRPAPNGIGLHLTGSKVKIGRGNVISANRDAGVVTESASASLTESLIGVAANGASSMPNKVGVAVMAGVITMRSNAVANSLNEGVGVADNASADLLGNRIYANGGAGIVASHRKAPVLVAAPRVGSGDDTTTWLVVKRIENVSLGRVEAFANTSCDDPEGRVPIDTLVLPNPLVSGDGLVWPLHGQPDRRYFTVTLTVDGRTTAFSNCVDANPSSPDTDGDGVPDEVEGILLPDAARNNKATAVPIEGKGWVLLVGSGPLRNVGTVEDPAPSAHAGITLPFGVLRFDVTPDASGKALVSVTTFTSTPNEYWKYGPPASGEAPTWYRFDMDATTGTGATRVIGTQAGLAFTRFDLTLIDGRRGDSDGRRNGVIVDPGGPAEVRDGGTIDLPPSALASPIPTPPVVLPDAVTASPASPSGAASTASTVPTGGTGASSQAGAALGITAPIGPAPAPATQVEGIQTSRPIAFTGAKDVVSTVVLSLVLIALGCTFLRISRRRRTS